MSDVDILYQIAKLKDTDYKNTLLLTSLVDLLIEKGIISKQEILRTVQTLDNIAISGDIIEMN